MLLKHYRYLRHLHRKAHRLLRLLSLHCRRRLRQSQTPKTLPTLCQLNLRRLRLPFHRHRPLRPRCFLRCLCQPRMRQRRRQRPLDCCRHYRL